MSHRGDQVSPFCSPYRRMSSDRRKLGRVEITNKNESFRRKVGEKLEFTEKVMPIFPVLLSQQVEIN